MKRWRYIFLLFLAAWLLTGLARIGPEERGVVRRFGRIVAHPGPGLWIGMPWGIDRVERIAARSVRQLAIGYEPPSEIETTPATPPGQLLTGDQNLIDVKLVVDYTVAENDDGLDRYSLNRNKVDAVLAREAESLAAEWVASRGVDDVLLTGRAELSRWLAAKLPQRLVSHDLGVVLQRVSIAHLAAPVEVREAFEAVNQAQTAIRTRETQALKEADQRKQQAETLRYQYARQAEAYRIEKLSAAKADAESFAKRLDQYRQAKATNPDALAAIWWEEMGRTLLGLKGRGRLDVLDAHLGKDGLDVTQFLPSKK
jgi:membrane protease subunit HflK